MSGGRRAPYPEAAAAWLAGTERRRILDLGSGDGRIVITAAKRTPVGAFLGAFAAVSFGPPICALAADRGKAEAA